VEVLTPSNTPGKVNRQRIVALSAGTKEFWVVDAEKRTDQITDLGGSKVFHCGDTILVRLLA
jgi:Uma2 family endonuclease